MITRVDEPTHRPWPQRAWLLAGLGALAGTGVGLITARSTEPSAGGLALATFLFTGFIALALMLERRRWSWAVAAAVGVGALLALVGWNTAEYDRDSWDFGWPFASALVASLILLPLFQTVRDQPVGDGGALRLPPGPVHDHVWADFVIGAVGVLFVGVVFLLVLLVDQLLRLVGITVIERLWDTDWFGWALAGAAFGAVAARLRDRAGLLGTLLTVKFAVLAVLAPVLAVGVALFLGALPFGGLTTFWAATGESTPILLACAGLAVWLMNAVIGGERGEGFGGRVLRVAALLLVLAILPLAGVSAAGLWIRVADLGWTPTRLWGAAAIVVALAWGATYLWTVVRARGLDEGALFAANVRLGLGVAGVALLLAVPVVDFGAVSARDQLARLTDGRVTPEKFDWAAMAFDFGPAGKRALEGLTRSRQATIAAAARDALKADSRWAIADADARESQIAARRAVALRPLRSHPDDVSIPAELRRAVFGTAEADGGMLIENRACDGTQEAPCDLYWSADRTIAVVTQRRCFPSDRSSEPPRCVLSVTPLQLGPKDWTQPIQVEQVPLSGGPDDQGEQAANRAAAERGDVEVRTVTRQQVFVGAKPVTAVFEAVASDPPAP